MAEAGKNDAKVEAAFRVVASTCDLTPAEVERLRTHPKSAGKIRPLAGTSPEYQRHVVGRLLAGDPSPFRQLASTLLVYDTVAFREVTSRLHRALGLVRMEADLLAAKAGSDVRPDRLGDRLLTLTLVAEQAGTLVRLLGDIRAVPGASGASVGGAGTAKTDVGRPDAADRLHAPAALGLVAKNVRNVAALQPAHRPTPGEKRTALSLVNAILERATAAVEAARAAFGNADEDCRVGPGEGCVRRIITHDQPDGDAVASAWLAERFLFAGEPVEILFVPRERVLGAYRRGDCLADVGNGHDPAELFFDHKPPALPDRHDSCAAELVWDHLRAAGRDVGHLRPFVNAVLAGDSARQRLWYRDEYERSKSGGFHAVLDRGRRQGLSDAELYREGRRWLDREFGVAGESGR